MTTFLMGLVFFYWSDQNYPITFSLEKTLILLEFFFFKVVYVELENHLGIFWHTKYLK